MEKWMVLVLAAFAGLCMLSSSASAASCYDEAAFNNTDLPKMWAIKLTDFKEEEGISDEEKLHRIVTKYGLRNLGQIGILEGHYLVMHEESGAKHSGSRKRSIDEVHESLADEEHVEWYEFQHPRRHEKRSDPNDPLFPQQWHLRNSNGVDLNVRPAWSWGYTGQGVTICVVDDGLEWRHSDLGSPRFKPRSSYDWNSHDEDPSPALYDDTHGTSCGGCAFAGWNDGHCGVGVAHGASFAAQRLISGPTTDAMEAQALGYMLNDTDIFTSSWGPTDDGNRLEGPGRLLQTVLEQGVKTGRHGRGVIYVWAGGNGGQRDNVNYDGYANSRFTIAVGSVESSGRKAYYSEVGASLVVSATSSPPGISTTAINNRCTDHFGGTSAASPMVAGIVALMLEANPNLTWRDVQDILIRSATKNDETDSDWHVNGAGLHVNHKYGYGLANAAAAVNLARDLSRPLLPPQLPDPVTTHFAPPQAVDIPDGSDGLTTFVDVTTNLVVEHVTITVRAVHSRRGDLHITLKSPSGIIDELMTPHNDRGTNIGGWVFTSMRHWGEDAVGRWTLTISDETPSNRGQLTKWSLQLYGHARN